MRSNFSFLACGIWSVMAFSCHQSAQVNPLPGRKTLSLQFIDSSRNPADEFYLFANGKWYDTATIAPTEFRAGARLEMDYITRAHIQSILQEAAKADSPRGSITQKVGDFYASGMDTLAIEQSGYEPIKPFLKQIDSIGNVPSIMKFVAEQALFRNAMLVGLYIGPDEKNSSKNILSVYQSGIGLPDRDYYFKIDAVSHAIVRAYLAYIATIFRLTGSDSAAAEKQALSVYNLELELARSHRSNVELRDPQSNYHKVSVAALDKQMPNIGWKKLLSDLRISSDSLNDMQPAYYERLNSLLHSVSLDTWKTYLRFHLIDGFASVLSKKFAEANFEFNGVTLSGQQQMEPRWQQVYTMIDNNLGEALGQLYVGKYFSADAKRKITELVNNLQIAFETRIGKLDWMSDSSKLKAKEKLHSFLKKVGYPDHWRDYSQVVIDRHDYVGNIISCGRNEYNHSISKLSQPVDKTEWQMTPPTNDAYYNPTINEIVFPAGILQYPMFDEASDDAMNYGGIGMVIGHELTHGFDDQGAQYDKEGNLKNWWSKEDYDKFTRKGQQVIDLYNGFKVFDSLHVNGRLTQGENTADFGGVSIAYDAFKLTKEGQDSTRIDGFTPDQRFFLSFAQVWRKKLKEEALRQQINTDPHSPANYRIMGPLMNFTPFYAAFNVKEGNKMYRPDSLRIRIW